MEWTPSEQKIFSVLNHPDKIQKYIDHFKYNPTDHASSPRWSMITQEAHCFEGALLAAAALEYHGGKPLLVDLIAEDDDHHVLAVYKTSTGWGSISKSNTTLLAGRRPFYDSIHELVMSYFDFYFNLKGRLSLYAYSAPINLNRFNRWCWRTSDYDLMEMGISFNNLRHYELVDKKKLKKLSPVPKKMRDACFLGADLEGLYRA
jgi:hypothetical protein